MHRAVFAEGLGSMLLAAAVIGSGIMAQRLTGDGAVALLANTLATAAALAVLIAMLAPASGAHFNPAVSLVAGALGVAITEAMVMKSWLLEDGPWYRLTDTGNTGLSALVVEPMPGRVCIDWTERKPHVAGPLGNQLAPAMLQKKLMLRDAKSRALRVTALGKETLGRVFGICVERLQISCKESLANAPAAEQIDDGQQNDCTEQ